MINLSKVLISQEEIKDIVKVCKSGQLVQGAKVAEFEKRFAKFCNVKYAVAVNSGTAALHSALYACGLGRGDEVITTPFTFVATVNAILMVGAIPVFADIDPNTFNIDPQKIEEKISKKTKAILPVHLYGHPADMERIMEIASRHKISVIEDSAQAVGAEIRITNYELRITNSKTENDKDTPGVAGIPALNASHSDAGGQGFPRGGGIRKKVGSIGDVGCFSFYATKNLFTGEGGMLVTNNKKIYERARMFRHHGQSEKERYKYYGLGYNYRMTEITAALGIEQLKKIDLVNKKRIENARRLTEGLKGIQGLLLPEVKTGYKHVFHQYTLRVTSEFKIKRSQLSEYLFKHGIGNSIYYPTPLHLFSHISRFGYKKGDFPVSEKLSREVLSIPVHQHLTARDINYIVNTIKKAVN